MPPRYAYWTILIDGAPTAFRAREKDELLPTLQQLRRTNKDVVLKWFARGRLWETPEAARAADRMPAPRLEKRGPDWRPGGAHKDPRDRFKKGAKRRDDRVHSPALASGGRGRPPRGAPHGTPRWRDNPAAYPPGGGRPWRDRPAANPAEARRSNQSPATRGPAVERRDAEPGTRGGAPSHRPAAPDPRTIKPDKDRR